MLIESKKANVIIDGQWGSSGKGKLAGYVYDNYHIDVAVCDYMPNAGHTVEVNGHMMVFRQLPVGAAYFGVQCLIGPHAAIDPVLFKQEVQMVHDTMGFRPKIVIHPLASVIQSYDRDAEQLGRGAIATTAKGGHAATCQKVLFPTDAKLARDDPQLEEWTGDTHKYAVESLHRGRTLLIETAQGFDLGLNHGWEFPYVTGRDCMVGRALDNAGVPVKFCGSIIGCIRTFPIRVGNTDKGKSGPCYHDQMEMGWNEVSACAGRPVMEMTTVTKRVRRVFSFSWTQLDRFLKHVSPSHLFVNFVNYLDAQPQQREQFLTRVSTMVRLYGGELSLLGTGPGAKDVEPFTCR